MLPLQDAQKYLEIVRKRGEAKKPINRVYRIIQCKELFLLAYANLYANKGALTPGVHPEDTIDGMSMKRIESIRNKLRKGEYQWTPVRRTYIGKRNSKKLRPLGMPGWNDKLLEEVIRLVLSAYYEPQFRDSSHGFREGRGCHTALKRIAKKGEGTRWFIEGDIEGCFDNIDHDVLMRILKRKIKDNLFLKLLREMLKAGYMENWGYHKTYSGTPQGGILSPLLTNIVLNELDMFVEDELTPKNTKGKERKWNLEYASLRNAARYARRKGKWKLANELRRKYTQLPSLRSNDRGYRRLWYVRYADDFLLGYIGKKVGAERIKQKLKDFLKTLKLEMSEEKTFITHALTGKARFLNYEINLANTNVKRTNGRRSVNHILWFSVPKDVIKRWVAKVSKGKKIIHRSELLNTSDYDIISRYEIELQGLINYYSFAHNVVRRMGYLRYIWQESLVKTLAAKHKLRKTIIYRKYRKFFTIDGRKIIGIEIERRGKKPLKTAFGRKQIQRKTDIKVRDDIQTTYKGRNDLLTRLLADTCEICGRTDNVEAHHIRKLADLKKKYKGRKEKPEWVKQMIARRRKSLFLCKEHHDEIHDGKYDDVKLMKN